MVIPLVTPSRFLFSDFLQQFTVNSNPHPAGSRRRFLLPEDISQVVQKSGGGEEQRSGRPVIHVVEKILGILIALSCCQRQPAASGIPILRHLLAKQIELAQCVLSELVSLLGRCHQPLERLLHILGEQLSLKKELMIVFPYRAISIALRISPKASLLTCSSSANSAEVMSSFPQ